jgi:hypothetical protein
MIGVIVMAQLASTLMGEGFQPIDRRGEVTVYRRPGQGALQLGAEGRIAAPVSTVRDALLDYGSHSRWVTNVAESRVLGKGDEWIDVYQRLKLPVVHDRDFTVHVVWGGTPEAPWLRFSTANERGPAPTHGTVRVSDNTGSWRLRSIDNGAATWAVYELTFDPAGSIPTWMGHGRAAKEIFTLFEHLSHEAQRRAR